MILSNSIVIRRITAYVIDIFIVSVIVGLILSNSGMRVNNYDDDKIDKLINDYASEKINTEEYINKYSDILYDINQESFNDNIVYLVVSIGYFLIFQFLNGGASIGKRIMNIRIVNRKKKNVSFWQLLIRVGLVNQIFSMLLLVIITKMLVGSSFLIGYGVVSMIRSLIIIMCIITLVFGKNNVSLHDKLSKSQVIIDGK